MKRGILSKSAILLFLCFCLACKLKKEVVRQPSPAPVRDASMSKTEILNNIIAKQADFNTFATRAKADVTIDNNGANNLTMIIRIQKDKAIWISVTAIAGLEVARALVTPDSIKIRNNLESTYIKKPFSYIYDFTNKQVNFNTLQAIFTGNAMPEFLTGRSAINTSGENIELTGMLDKLAYTLTFNGNYKVTQADLKDESAGQSLTAAYGDFTSVSQQIFPGSVNIKSDAVKKHVSIDLNYSRTEVNAPVDMPFSIPQRFTVKD